MLTPNKKVYEYVLMLLQSDAHLKIGTSIEPSRIWGVCAIISWVNTGELGSFDSNRYVEWVQQKPPFAEANCLWWPIEDRKSRIKALKKAIKLCKS